MELALTELSKAVGGGGLEVQFRRVLLDNQVELQDSS